jgi:copper chaperone CopZ
MTQIFTVTNFHCAACAKVTSLTLAKLTGVEAVAVDEKTGRVELTVAAPLDQKMISETLAAKGYETKWS